MAILTCKVNDCEGVANTPGAAKGYCAKHYYRFQKHGNPFGGRLPNGAGVPERVARWTTLDPVSGCWNWEGHRNRHGYGAARYQGATIGAHRMTYLHYKGEIPIGFHIDHLCNNRACVNPDHLEAVTFHENQARRDQRMQAADAGKGRKRLKLPYLMSVPDMLKWAADKGVNLDEIRISFGYEMLPPTN